MDGQICPRICEDGQKVGQLRRAEHLGARIARGCQGKLEGGEKEPLNTGVVWEWQVQTKIKG